MELAHRIVGKSAKYLFVTVCCVYVAVSSSWEPFYFLAGAVVNAVLSKILKRAIKIPRPELSSKPGYGMPSSHAQSMCYFLALLSVKRHFLFDAEHLNFIFLAGMTIYISLARCGCNVNMLIYFNTN